MNHTPARQHRTSASGGIHSCEAPAPIFLDAEIPFGTSRRYELFTVAGAPPVSSIQINAQILDVMTDRCIQLTASLERKREPPCVRPRISIFPPGTAAAGKT